MINRAALDAFLSGALALGFGVIALSFQRFWRRTGIRLFNLFAVAFVVLALERVVEVITTHSETAAPVYIMRLIAFCLIIAAIFNHNRGDGRS